MRVMRGLVIAVLMILAAFFLGVGAGARVPLLPWRWVAARDIPIGIVLVLAGLAVARFWAIPLDEAKLLDDWQRRRKPRG